MGILTYEDYLYADEDPPLDDQSSAPGPSNHAANNSYPPTSLSETTERIPSLDEIGAEIGLDEDLAMAHVATSPPKKRAKKHHQVPKEYQIKRGGLSLSALLDLPRAIFAEIASHFEPRDLLYLSRSSKQLRAVLMSKSAQAIWSQSRNNLPSFEPFAFPKCPSDLPEPAYASLVFGTDCLNCGAKAKFVNFHYRLRSCGGCFKGHVGLGPAQGDIGLFRSLLEAQGVQPLGDEPGDEPGDAELEMIRALVLASDGEHPQFFGPTALSVYQQCMARRARIDPYDYERYLLSRQKDMEGIKQHAVLLKGWNKLYLGMQKQRLQNHLQSLSDKRSSEITGRLIEMGYAAQDFPKRPNDARAEPHNQDSNLNNANYQTWRTLVLLSSPLSENGPNGWDTIKPILEVMLSDNKKRRLAWEGRSLKA